MSGKFTVIEVGGQSNESGLGKFIADCEDPTIETPPLLNNNDTRPGA